MRTIVPRRFRPSALLALAMVLGAPALVQAQLFPNLPLHKRQKPDCSQENPQNRTIRQEYWGHYPTCWRRFPPGWGCPSPEAPNWEQAKRDFPLEELPESPNGNRDTGEFDTLPPEDTGTNPRPAPNDNELPPLPNEEGSIFDQPINPPARPSPSLPGAAPSNPAGDRPPGELPPGGLPTTNPPADLPPRTTQTSTTKPQPRRSVLAGLLSTRRR